uniref:Uncharacterized protein n=1 Tax=Cacopsylla melanoneura TaxID=428564 RepID=A0A8D8X669_9HEMI
MPDLGSLVVKLLVRNQAKAKSLIGNILVQNTSVRINRHRFWNNFIFVYLFYFSLEIETVFLSKRTNIFQEYCNKFSQRIATNFLRVLYSEFFKSIGTNFLRALLFSKSRYSNKFSKSIATNFLRVL